MTKSKFTNRVFLEHYGVTYSTQELSRQLTDLNICHAYQVESKWAFVKKDSLDNQPALPLLISNLTSYLVLRKNTRKLPELDKPLIAFVFAPVSVLKCTNLNLLCLTEEWSPKKALIQATKKIQLASVPTVTIHTIEQFILKETKPSLMHDFQTAIYKVKPNLRSEARKLVIQFFRGECSANRLKKFLTSDQSLEAILVVLQNPKARDLAQAVFEVKTKPITEVAKKLDLDVFDINYLVNRNSL